MNLFVVSLLIANQFNQKLSIADCSDVYSGLCCDNDSSGSIQICVSVWLHSCDVGCSVFGGTIDGVYMTVMEVAVASKDKQDELQQYQCMRLWLFMWKCHNYDGGIQNSNESLIYSVAGNESKLSRNENVTQRRENPKDRLKVMKNGQFSFYDPIDICKSNSHVYCWIQSTCQ